MTRIYEKKKTVGVQSDVPLPLHMHAAVFATGQWLYRWCFNEYGHKCQCFSSSMSRSSFCVMSEGGKLCTRLIAKVIRISHAKFHCNRLTTVQDIQDYTSLILLTHHIVVSLCQKLSQYNAASQSYCKIEGCNFLPHSVNSLHLKHEPVLHQLAVCCCLSIAQTHTPHIKFVFSDNFS